MTTPPAPHLPTAPTTVRLQPNELEAVEDFRHHRHHHEHHEVAVKAFELHEQTVTAGGVDYGPEFYWYTALWEMGIIPSQPLPPPTE